MAKKPFTVGTLIPFSQWVAPRGEDGRMKRT